MCNVFFASSFKSTSGVEGFDRLTNRGSTSSQSDKAPGLTPDPSPKERGAGQVWLIMAPLQYARSRALTVLSTSSLVLYPAPWGLLLENNLHPQLRTVGYKTQKVLSEKYSADKA
jgi:hypothetical protein